MIDFSPFKHRQWHIFGGILVCLLVLCFIFWAISTRDAPPKPQQMLKSSLVTGASRINPQEAWVYQFKTESELAKKRLDAVEGMLEKLLKINATKNADTKHLGRKSSNSSKILGNSMDLEDSDASVSDASVSDTSVSIESVREALKSHQNADKPSSRDGTLPSGPPSQGSSGQVLPPPPDSSNEPATTPQNSFRSKAVRKITLPLKNARSSKALKSFDNTIPAGAFAKAILLGGVDASASIQASSDPRPALLRLTDAGTLPRKFRSDLKGCHALAACYGDISSERVFMRLEKLTCTERKTGEILEVKVQGYVAGEDGRTGVRGSVVDRAGESMRNVLMGGFLGGIGEFISQSHNAAITLSPMAGIGGLAQTGPSMGMKDMLKHGAGKGVNNALDKYADFYIKRAEQLQPVIQVAAGRQVDIVFTEGVSLEGSVYRQALGRSNDQGRYQQIQAVQESPQKSLTDWTDASGTNASGTGVPGTDASGTDAFGNMPGYSG